MFAVELHDPHPVWGGDTVRAPFIFRETARVWAEREVESARELGMGSITFRIVPLSTSREPVR